MKDQNGVFIEVPFNGQLAGLCIKGQKKFFGVAMSEYESYRSNNTLKLISEIEYYALVEELDRKKYIDKKPVLISEEYFDQLLKCSISENYGIEYGVRQFRMGRYEKNNITLQAGEYRGVYLTKHIYAYDPSTWLSICDFENVSKSIKK